MREKSGMMKGMVDKGVAEQGLPIDKKELSRRDILRMGGMAGIGLGFAAVFSGCGRSPDGVESAEIGESDKINKIKEGSKIPINLEGVDGQVFASVIYGSGAETVEGADPGQVSQLHSRFGKNSSGEEVMVCQPINPDNPPKKRLTGEILEPKVYLVKGNPDFDTNDFGLHDTPGKIQFAMGENTRPVSEINRLSMNQSRYAIPVSAIGYDFYEGKGYREGGEMHGDKPINQGWAIVEMVTTESMGLVMLVKGYEHDGRVLLPERAVGLEELGLGA